MKYVVFIISLIIMTCSGTTIPDWPKDADGDALRRIWKDGVDFSVTHSIDFQIDFRPWPPSKEALHLIEQKYGSFKIIEPDSGGPGYVEISENMMLDYDAIIREQRDISESARQFGGNCQSWGLFVE